MRLADLAIIAWEYGVMSLIDMGRSPSSNGPAALGGSDILFLGGSAAAAAVTSTPAALPAAASTSRAVFLDPPALPPVAVGPAGVRHHDVCDLGGMLRDLGDRRPPAVGWIVDEDAVHHDRVRLDFLFSKGTSPARPTCPEQAARGSADPSHHGGRSRRWPRAHRRPRC